MISKELLSEVVGLCCGVKCIRNSEVVYWFNCIGEVREGSINIYELAYLCKEWASKHHYSVMSGWEMTHWGGAYRVAVFRNSDNILFSMSTVKTEPEAIFRACEWILEQVTKK